jgi:hypothetical protein
MGYPQSRAILLVLVTTSVNIETATELSTGCDPADLDCPSPALGWIPGGRRRPHDVHGLVRVAWWDVSDRARFSVSGVSGWIPPLCWFEVAGEGSAPGSGCGAERCVGQPRYLNWWVLAWVNSSWAWVISGRWATSGIPTSHHAPDSVHEFGWVLMTTTAGTPDLACSRAFV